MAGHAVGRWLAGLAALAGTAFVAGGALAFTDQQNPFLGAGRSVDSTEKLEQPHRTAFNLASPAIAGIGGVVSWGTLAEFDYEYESPFPGATSFTRSFGAAVKALDGDEIRLAGFIYPLEGGDSHERFLFSGFPPGCPFCLPAGPDQLVEVLAAEPVRFTKQPVILAGRFELLHGDPSGLFYRLHDARRVEP